MFKKPLDLLQVVKVVVNAARFVVLIHDHFVSATPDAESPPQPAASPVPEPEKTQPNEAAAT